MGARGVPYKDQVVSKNDGGVGVGGDGAGGGEQGIEHVG